jgi:hypothetical protein
VKVSEFFWAVVDFALAQGIEESVNEKLLRQACDAPVVVVVVLSRASSNVGNAISSGETLPVIGVISSTTSPVIRTLL